MLKNKDSHTESSFPSKITIYVNITRNIPTCPWFMHSNTKTGEVSNVINLNFYLRQL